MESADKDKELLKKWMKPGAMIPVSAETVRILHDALMDGGTKRDWIDLTDEEIFSVENDHPSDLYQFTRAIEKMIKEKNS